MLGQESSDFPHVGKVNRVHELVHAQVGVFAVHDPNLDDVRSHLPLRVSEAQDALN